MELDIAGSKSSPKIHFNKEENRVVIHGRSVLKNMDDPFFYPLFSFLKKYKVANEKGLTVEFYLDYFNTSTHPSLIKIFELSGEIEDVKVIWLYDPNDMEMMEIGQELQVYSPVKFDIKLVEKV